MDRLAEKVVVISGAARGQGEAEARLFVAEGARVLLGAPLVASPVTLQHAPIKEVASTP